jgi:MFS family permease
MSGTSPDAVLSRRKFLAPLALAQFICSFAGSNMNVMINDITKDLDTTVTGVQAAITLFLLIMAILMIPCSKLTDRWGRKRCFTAGLVLYGIGALLSAVSPGLGILIVGNSVLEGVGTALLIPPVYILTTLRFGDVTSRARAFGVISGLGGIGAAAGPLIGGVITTGISWRAAFVFQALVVFAIVVLSRRIEDPVAPDPSRPFDVVGAVLSAAGMFCVVLGILQADSDPALMAALLAIGAALLAGFFIYVRGRERAGKEPLLSTAMFKNRTANLGLATQNIQWLLLMGVSFVVAVFLQTVRGYNAIETGVIFTAATVGVLASSLGAERFARRRRQKTLIMAGFVVTAAGIGVLLALVLARGGLRARPPAHRPRARRDADPVGQPRAVELPRAAAGRDLGAVAQHLEPRLVLRHGDRRHDPGLGPRVGQHVVRARDDRPGSIVGRRARRRDHASGPPRGGRHLGRPRGSPRARRVGGALRRRGGRGGARTRLR